MEKDYIEELGLVLFKAGLINGTFKRITTTFKNKEQDFIQSENHSKEKFNFYVNFNKTFIKVDAIENICLTTQDNLKTRQFLKEHGYTFFQKGTDVIEVVFKKSKNILPTVEELSEYLHSNNIIDNFFWRDVYKDGYIHLKNTTSDKVSISDEVYGKEACIFIRFKNEEDYLKALEKLTFDNISYESLDSSKRIEFKVDYFKGWHWDE